MLPQLLQHHVFRGFLVWQWQLIIYSGHEFEKFFRGLNRANLIDGVRKMLTKFFVNDSGRERQLEQARSKCGSGDGAINNFN
jgi:hypothetical protein